MNKANKKVVLMGECMMELRQSGLGVMQQSFAGDAYNTAVYLKRAFVHQQVSFMTSVGQDLVSQQMQQSFAGEDLDLQYVFAKSCNNPGIYLVQTDEQGERSFLYWREHSAARELMHFVDEETISELCDTDLFFFSGISLAVLEPTTRPAFWQMLQRLKNAGVQIAFDPNYRPRLWPDKKVAQDEFIRAFTLANIVLPGVEDFKQLYDLEELSDILEFCQPFDIGELVIKNGASSVYCQVASNLVHLPVEQVKKVVDTTSAGDSFNGVYLGARLAGQDIEQALKLAAGAAGLVIQYPGAIIPAEIFEVYMQENSAR
jgi:2-dehydro-3-deoxygluconokinase